MDITLYKWDSCDTSHGCGVTSGLKRFLEKCIIQRWVIFIDLSDYWQLYLFDLSSITCLDIFLVLPTLQQVKEEISIPCHCITGQCQPWGKIAAMNQSLEPWTRSASSVLWHGLKKKRKKDSLSVLKLYTVYPFTVCVYVSEPNH